MHSVADLTTFARKTTGEVPPHLVGASSTVYRSKLYVFGGRFNVENRMASDIYELDLKTWNFTKLEIDPDDDDVPPPRYFHSADIWNNHLVIFGGMGYRDDAVTFDKDDLCVYDDVRLFDLSTRHWVNATPNYSAYPDAPQLIPGARYAHLSSINGSKLTIIGGQDLDSQWLGNVHVYDLELHTWISTIEYPKYCGAYRSIAVSSPTRVVAPANENPDHSSFPVVQPTFQLQNAPLQSFRQRSPLVHLPYTDTPLDGDSNDIYLYSNFNFTDVKRELVVFESGAEGDLTITDRSDEMRGSSLPPGLRFPTGVLIGTHMLIAGTYLAHTHQSFSLWTLDLATMEWSRLETGAVLTSGSWCRGGYWEEENKFLVFGNRNSNLVDDYNRRILSWDDVASVDLEAYGIYCPPSLLLDLKAQELGLAALEEELLADFEIICDDGRRIKCNRKVLERRWPWFEKQRRFYLASASKLMESIPKTTADVPLPELEDGLDFADAPPDPRLTPRSFYLSEPYAITLGFVQYLYTLALITQTQHAPAVLSGLLLLATTYELPHLESLVRHAMHRMLSPHTSVGVYEMATVCDCQNLQIRALKYVMMSSRRTPTRVSGTRDHDYSEHDHGDRNGDGGGGGGRPGSSQARGFAPEPPPKRSQPTSGTNGVNGSGGYMLSTSPDVTAPLARQPSRVSLPSRSPISPKSSLHFTPSIRSHSQGHSRRKRSGDSGTATYGDSVSVHSERAGRHRRGWSSTDEVIVPTAQELERVGSQRSFVSASHGIPWEGDVDKPLPEVSAFDTAESFSETVETASTWYGHASSSSHTPESPPILTPLESVYDYGTGDTVHVVEGHWEPNYTQNGEGDEDYSHPRKFDQHKSQASSVDYHIPQDPFAAQSSLPGRRLRHTSSTPAMNTMHQRGVGRARAEVKMTADNEGGEKSFFDTSLTTYKPEKKILSRLRLFTMNGSSRKPGIKTVEERTEPPVQRSRAGSLAMSWL